LLEQVLDRLACEYGAKGQSELFDQLKIVLTRGRGSVPGATLAEQLGKSEEAVHMAVHRLRKRYREILEEQITATLEDPGELEDEIRSLFEAIST
jgi:RNA polymerase sigma-70 factor (ECF subfamily)